MLHLPQNCFPLFIVLFLFTACDRSNTAPTLLVSNKKELNTAISNAQPGDEIVLVNGTWKDVEIRFQGKGTASQPIVLRAEAPGLVTIEGKSDLKLAGQYLVVSGLHFKNGTAPSSAVMQFRIDKENIAFNCRITNCVIEGFNKAQRNESDLWVRFHGRNNQLDHCYLAGKSNRGPTIRVDLVGNESIKNHHIISHNHFGPRPPKGGPSAETIQIGTSSTSMVPSYTLVANNLFESCNGEVEIISSKSNFNEFRNNVFYKSEGSLVTRHGNYCIIDGNYFIGEEGSDKIGGIRLIGTGHWVTNNYFYKLKGQAFRSPLAVMNGIPKSPLNRYIQVTDVVVAHNSWIDCKSPWQFGIGSNVDQKEVLPASEIRSERPIRTIVANNLIYNATGDPKPIVAHDLLDGINFQSNIINNQGVAFESIEGLQPQKIELTAIGENCYAPTGLLQEPPIYKGFEFENISTDLLGASRKNGNSIGATSGSAKLDPDILNPSKYGAFWYSSKPSAAPAHTHAVSPATDISAVIRDAQAGDTIKMEGGRYDLSSSLIIDKALSIQSANPNNKAIIQYRGAVTSPAFEMNPGGSLILKDIVLKGTLEQYAFASLKKHMSSLYNLALINCEVSDFDYLLKAYKYSFFFYLSFQSSTFSNCNNGLELSEEREDRGEYNAENIFIEACRFEGIKSNVIDYYRGGYDESTVGGTLVVSNSSFTNSGSKEETGILINTYGIVNVDISGNTFTNNKVRLVALLWGAKNNSHSNNNISNSGTIKVEENLKLNLLY